MSYNDSVVMNQMIEIFLYGEEDFLKIKETLNRIGVSSNESVPPKIYPSCVLFHKQGRYYISHFKLMFAMQGGTANISALDLKRQYTIAYLLDSWKLCQIRSADVFDLAKENFDPKLVKIVPFQEAKKWEIISRFTVGKKIPAGA